MKYVTIEGKRQPIEFNMAAMLELEEFLEQPFTSVLLTLDSLSSAKIMKLAYLGLKYGCDAMEKRCPLTYSAFVNYARGNNDIVTEIIAIIALDIKRVVAVLEEEYKLKGLDAATTAEVENAEEVDAAKKKDVSGIISQDA